MGVLRKLVDVEDDNVEDVDVEDDEVEDVDVEDELLEKAEYEKTSKLNPNGYR